MSRRITGYGVGSAKIDLAPVPVKNNGIPTSTTAFDFGQLIENKASGTWYIYSGGSTYVAIGGSGAVNGTVNQIVNTFTNGSSVLSLSPTLVAPGSVTATTTLTATSGNVTATSGNFVAPAPGTGLVLNSPTATGAASGPVIVNGRSGQAIFTGVSIAAGATLALTITNSAVTASTTQVVYSLAGATAGAALTIASVVNSAGSSVVTVTNGTGATTSIANIALTFLVLN